MSPATLIAGVLAICAAVIHGGLGEALVVARLDVGTLPRTRFGGTRMTLVMIRATWHLLTVSFAGLGTALSVCSAHAHTEACRSVGTLSAGTFAAYAVVALGIAFATTRRLPVRKHPAPLIFIAVAVLSWLGTR